MKIGIVSDTHDNLTMIKRAVAALKDEGPELVLHSGDFVAPFAIIPWRDLGCRIVGVFGNNDGEKVGLLKMFETVGELHLSPHSFTHKGLRILLMHEPFALEELLECGRFDLIAYGHTHKSESRAKNGTILVNPGECCGWLDGEPSIAVVDTTAREVKNLRL